METKIDTFVDELQYIIDDIKNKPEMTEILTVVIRKTDRGINNVIFMHVPNDSIDIYKNKLVEITKEFIETH
jgi:hypothetical protein